MNKGINLLDCTLREAPVDRLQWGGGFIRQFVRGLEDAGIDIIEIGFLKNEEHIEGSSVFSSVEQIEKYIPSRAKSEYVALVDYGRFDAGSLKENNGRSVDGIRICFKKEEMPFVVDYAKKIADKGYWVSIQQVDTRGYSDDEILRFLEHVNKLKPRAFSIVDTFGSLYEEDAEYLYRLIHHNLDKDIALGFHAHNNLMLAASNSQRFVTDLYGKRALVIDGSVHGCGRGAGNAHTELLAEYINLKQFGKYDVNRLLDVIDDVLPQLKEKGKWGYSIPYFIAGLHAAHVFNIDFLMSRHNIRSSDLRDIISGLDDSSRRRYDYPLLEKMYVDHFDNSMDDRSQRQLLRDEIGSREVLILAPGRSVAEYGEEIARFIKDRAPYIIHLNMKINGFPYNRIFCSSQKRLDLQNSSMGSSKKWVVTSNLHLPDGFDGMKIDYRSLIKFGWINIDNAGVLALRLVKSIGIKKINVAGFDGYNYEKSKNFYSVSMQRYVEDYVIDRMNADIREMIQDIMSDNASGCAINFITPSKYVMDTER